MANGILSSKANPPITSLISSPLDSNIVGKGAIHDILSMLAKTSLFLLIDWLTINGILGMVPYLLIVEKFLKKNPKSNKYNVLQVLPKSNPLGQLLKNFRTFISFGGLLRDYHWRGGIQEIHDFRVFLRTSDPIFAISS